MQSFTYHAPRSVSEATQLLAAANGNSVFLAGGTDILVQLRENLRHASQVIDVKHIAELTELCRTEQHGLLLGAAVTCRQLLDDESTEPYSALRDAAQIIGGWQIQSRATIGGNLCNSSPAADSVPALLALGAKAEYATPAGRKELPVSQFCTAPGKNVLEGKGLLVSIAFPPPGKKSGSAYQRFIPRYEMDIAVASAASYLELADDETVTEARIALGAVGPTAVLAEEAAALLIGNMPDEATIEAAARKAATYAKPIDDMRGTIEFRQQLAYVMVKRTLQTALRRAAGEVISAHPL